MCLKPSTIYELFINYFFLDFPWCFYSKMVFYYFYQTLSIFITRVS